jgi:GNAT superfamily N-acetyltransferase
MAIDIRPARERDLASVMSLVRALADFEKLPGPPGDADARLAQHFAEGRFSLLVADDGGTLVGYALYFFTYSTFVVGPSLYLEDLFVLPEVRGAGLGRRFMQALAQVAQERGCERFEWCVLDWNVRAQKFYRSLGAEILDSWRVCRLLGPAIAELARSPATP